MGVIHAGKVGFTLEALSEDIVCERNMIFTAATAGSEISYVHVC